MLSETAHDGDAAARRRRACADGEGLGMVEFLKRIFGKTPKEHTTFKYDADDRGMINAKDHPVEWALMLYDLDEVREHIESLIKDMQEDEEFCQIDLDVHLSHIYQHLNRAWNARNMSTDLASEKFEEISKFPTDLSFC